MLYLGLKDKTYKLEMLLYASHEAHAGTLIYGILVVLGKKIHNPCDL